MPVLDNNIQHAKAVIELTSPENVNRHLDAGWCLIATHTWDEGNPQHCHQRTVYSLMWPQWRQDVIRPELDPRGELSRDRG